jgi:hypothetical protein
MKFGIQIPAFKDWWFGKSKDWAIGVILPATSLGYIDDYDDKWFGFKLKLKTDISFESYEYGKIFTFAIFGLGFTISKYNIKIK